jgi:hypothetical protein
MKTVAFMIGLSTKLRIQLLELNLATTKHLAEMVTLTVLESSKPKVTAISALVHLLVEPSLLILFKVVTWLLVRQR